MAMAMVHFVVYTSFVFLLCFHDAYTECTYKEIKGCMGGYSSMDGALYFVGLLHTADNFCKTIDKIPSCLKNIGCEGNVKHSIYLDVSGAYVSFKYLCTSDYARRVSLDNRACLSSAFHYALRNCTNDTVSGQMTGDPCRRLNEAIKCKYEVIKTRCNEKAAYVLAILYKKFYSKSACAPFYDTSYVVKPKNAPSHGADLDPTNSNRTDSNPNGFSRMTSSITSSVMLFIMVVVLSYR